MRSITRTSIIAIMVLVMMFMTAFMAMANCESESEPGPTQFVQGKYLGFKDGKVCVQSDNNTIVCVRSNEDYAKSMGPVGGTVFLVYHDQSYLLEGHENLCERVPAHADQYVFQPGETQLPVDVTKGPAKYGICTGKGNSYASRCMNNGKLTIEKEWVIQFDDTQYGAYLRNGGENSDDIVAFYYQFDKNGIKMYVNPEESDEIRMIKAIHENGNSYLSHGNHVYILLKEGQKQQTTAQPTAQPVKGDPIGDHIRKHGEIGLVMCEYGNEPLEKRCFSDHAVTYTLKKNGTGTDISGTARHPVKWKSEGDILFIKADFDDEWTQLRIMPNGKIFQNVKSPDEGMILHGAK